LPFIGFASLRLFRLLIFIGRVAENSYQLFIASLTRHFGVMLFYMQFLKQKTAG
jgi:hypothetical protein